MSQNAMKTFFLVFIWIRGWNSGLKQNQLLAKAFFFVWSSPECGDNIPKLRTEVELKFNQTLQKNFAPLEFS